MHGIQCIFLALISCSVLLVCSGEPKNFRFCGNHLAEALQLACEDTGYNVPYWDASPSVETTTEPAVHTERIGVATECCHHGCTWSTLLSYCQDSRKKSKISQMDDLLYAKLRFGHLIIGQKDDHKPSLKMAGASSPEVAVTKKHRGRKGRNRRMGRNGKKKRKGRGGRKSNAPNRCDRRMRPARARKMHYENVKRSAPLFGTVSPEYLRLPRTLDEVPYPYHKMQAGF